MIFVVTDAVAEEMTAVWSGYGTGLLAAMGEKPMTREGSGTLLDLDQFPQNVIATLKFVAEQRILARQTRRRRGVKNDTRKQKTVTT